MSEKTAPKKRGRGGTLLLALLSMVLTCWYPCVFLYAQNVAEAPFTSMFPFFLIFLANAAALFLLNLLLIHRLAAAAFLADLTMLAVINFTILYNFLKDRFSLSLLETWYPLAAVLGLLLLSLLVLLCIKKPNLQKACLLVSLVFGALIVFNFVSAAITVLGSGESATSLADTKKSYEPKTFGENRPNVYYFIFDEYGGPQNLEHYFFYDNSPFLDSLRDRGFTVSEDSHNTESVFTTTLVPNLMNLDYVADDEMSSKKLNKFLQSPNLFQLFSDNGYSINLINHMNYIGTEGCQVLTQKQSRRTISDYLLKNSLYTNIKPLKKLLNQYIKADYVATYLGPLNIALDAGRTCWQQVGSEPTLTMGYYQFPHAPTILDKNGNLVDDYENVGWNWDNFDLYLGQLQYCSSFILELVDGIQQHDPDALIVVQSDHGCRQAIHYCQMGLWDTYDPAVDNPLMQNILNCVYYRGERFDIAGQSGINSLRRILNQVFGTDYEMIDPVVYTGVTKKLAVHVLDVL